VLPYILREDARVYLAVVGDSAKSTIDYFDQLWLNKSETGLASQLQAVAIVEGNEIAEDIISDKFRTFLAGNGKKWLNCPRLPFGRLVQTPASGGILDIADFPFIPPQRNLKASGSNEAEEDDDDSWETTSDADDTEAKQDASSIMSATGAQDHAETDAAYVDVKDEAYEGKYIHVPHLIHH